MADEAVPVPPRQLERLVLEEQGLVVAVDTHDPQALIAVGDFAHQRQILVAVAVVIAPGGGPRPHPRQLLARFD